jgi:hypothetical protein
MSCKYDVYHSDDNVFEMPAVLRALLEESGTYIHKLVYNKDIRTTRNPFFAVCIHTDHGGEPYSMWRPAEIRFRVSLCYELTEEFPLSEDSNEFQSFRESMERMVPHEVNLIPFNSFERCFAVYDRLLELCVPSIENKPNQFLCVMRRNNDSPIDLRRCLVMRSQVFLHPGEMWDSRVMHSECTPCAHRSTLTSFFRDISRIRWYTTYAHAVLSVDAPDGMNLYSVGKCKQHWLSMVSKAHIEEDEQRLLSAKISLLETVEKTYRYKDKA